MATSDLTECTNITTCPICLEELKTPKCLPCLHNFCEECLNSHINAVFESEGKRKVGRKFQFDCPVCRRTITPTNQAVEVQEYAKQFPTNYWIVSLVEQYNLRENMQCDICLEHTVVRICQDCKVKFCNNCVAMHKRMRVCRNHELNSIKEFQSKEVTVLCEDHTGIRVEAFCKDHDQPCCSMCIDIYHRQCDRLMTLEEAANGTCTSRNLSDLLQRLRGTIALNENIIREKEQNVQALKNQKCFIQNELLETRQRIIDRFDQLHSVFMQRFLQTHYEKVKELTDCRNEIEKRTKTIQHYYNLMETCRARSSETQMFLEMKKILKQEKEQVGELDQIQEKHKIVEYEFKLNDDIKKLVTRSQSVGQIDVTEKASVFVPRFPKHCNLSRLNLKVCMLQPLSSLSIKDECEVDTFVYGGFFMPDNSLLLPLFHGRRLAIFQCSGDLIKQSGDLSGFVYDVCMLDPTTAVVTRCSDHVIDYINIPTLTVNKTIPVGTRCSGIASSDSRLYVGCENKLLVLDKDGNREKAINTNGTITGVTLVNQGQKKIVYNNYNKNSCHFVRSSDLQEVHKFTHPEFEHPRGITSDREGNVYTAGSSSGNVLQLTSEGILIRVLIQGLDNPRGIQFDDATDRFFVCCSYPGNVKMYKMIKP